MDFEEWWNNQGQFIDPDFSDVPWIDKRKELSLITWNAAKADAPKAPEPKDPEAADNQELRHGWEWQDPNYKPAPQETP